MKKSALTFATLCMLAMPAAATAQGFGVAARVGTLGAGAEVAVGLTNRLVVRGGIGLLPLKPSMNVNNMDFTLTLPKTWYNVGLDLYVAGPMRIGVGMLFKSANPVVDGTVAASKDITIGNKTYTTTQQFGLHGIFDSKKQAPYALIGFGKHTASGVGLFLDLGAAFVGEPTVTLTASGDPKIRNDPQFQTELQQEQTDLQNKATYLKIWPILNLGIRIGL
jgi:hypothetical protein